MFHSIQISMTIYFKNVAHLYTFFTISTISKHIRQIVRGRKKCVVEKKIHYLKFRAFFLSPLFDKWGWLRGYPPGGWDGEAKGGLSTSGEAIFVYSGPKSYNSSSARLTFRFDCQMSFLYLGVKKAWKIPFFIEINLWQIVQRENLCLIYRIIHFLPIGWVKNTTKFRFTNLPLFLVFSLQRRKRLLCTTEFPDIDFSPISAIF